MARDHDAAAEAVVVRLNEADHLPIGIRSTQIDGAATRGFASVGIAGPLADQRRPSLVVGRIEQPLDRYLCVLLVTDVGITVGEGELHGLDVGVPSGGIELVVVGRIGVLRNPQRDQRGNPLSIRGDLPDLVFAVGDADRVDPFGVVSAEVIGGQAAAGFGGIGRDRLGDLAFVEVTQSAFAERSQTVRMARAGPQSARVRSHPVGSEDRRPVL